MRVYNLQLFSHKMANVYVTYDLDESGQAKPFEEYHGTKLVGIQADSVLRWEVGEFKRAWGRDVYGVKIFYRSKGQLATESVEVVEIPANAQNVNVCVDVIPELYRRAL